MHKHIHYKTMLTNSTDSELGLHIEENLAHNTIQNISLVSFDKESSNHF